MYNKNLHSTNCLIIMRSELMWLTQDLFGLKLFCSVRRVVFKTGATNQDNETKDLYYSIEQGNIPPVLATTTVAFLRD